MGDFVSFENKTLPISTTESLNVLQQNGLLSSNDFDIKKILNACYVYSIMLNEFREV